MKIKTQLTSKNHSFTLEQEAKLFRLFANWSKKRKYEYIKKCPKERALRLKYTWQAWARDKQLAPDGEWSTWVIQAGRGFGKTLAGAQWVIDKAQMYPGCHIALVGRTVADVRDVMIKGRSGILSVSPPWFRPIYYPSKRQMVWPNGSTATTYSADEPDQLRGPQHSFAWGDERCFVAGTLIRTSTGVRPIEEIQPGDLVHTREGLRRVKHAGLTSSSTTVYDLTTTDGRVLTGTGNHPIWVQDKGFKPLHSLSYGDILMVWDQVKLDIASYGVGVDGGSMEATIATEKERCYIEPFTQQLMGLSLRGCTFTTKTAIKQTTTFLTSKRLRQQNTLHATRLKGGVRGKRKNAKRLHGSNGTSGSHTLPSVNNAVNLSLQRERARDSVVKIVRRLIDVKTLRRFHPSRVNNAVNLSWFINLGCAIVRTNVGILPNKSRQVSVLSAKKSLRQKVRKPSAVHENVVLSTNNETANLKKEFASIAKNLSPLIFPRQKWFFAQEHAGTYTESKTNDVQILKVVPRTEKMAVFNMEVEDCHEYFANDILVHNCSWQYDDAWDQLSFGLRIEPSPGIAPQCLVTTTPRNTKAMKLLVSDPTTVITHGSTYENKENLSPRFIREIERRYQGTRLGDQEIEGYIIDDIDGALWKRDWIDRNRVVKHPELKRIVVGVDPPASSSETSDAPAECGIIVAGLGVDNHGYMLADYSLIGTPDEWASAVLTAYAMFEADVIVGEVNNGGDMVGTVIRSVAKDKKMGSISYKAVRATRGKQLRAEPISTLSQRDLIHHVGVFPDTEYQQCNWVPGEKSPDRLDGYVWAFTELMAGGFQVGGMVMATGEESEEEDELSDEEEEKLALWR